VRQGRSGEMLTSLPAEAGTYALVLRLRRRTRLPIGALGEHALPAGWYVYVGSARGPGGLAARVGRHWRGDGARHWHIDYLQPALRLTAVWWAPGAARRECAWARALQARPGATAPVPRCGASDCRCPAHLWHFAAEPPRLALASFALALP